MGCFAPIARPSSRSTRLPRPRRDQSGAWWRVERAYIGEQFGSALAHDARAHSAGAGEVVPSRRTRRVSDVEEYTRTNESRDCFNPARWHPETLWERELHRRKLRGRSWRQDDEEPKCQTLAFAAEAQRPSNRILGRLPDDAFRRLAPHLRVITLTPKLVIQPINAPIHEIVFPDGGVVSVTTSMADGEMVEVATVGAEGLVGINAFLAGATANAESMVQVPGASASVLPISVFRSEIDRSGPFRESVQRYTQGLMGLMMQSAGCLALHSVQQRCCRWLLMAHDRVGCDEFHLSQEFLAAMLGSTRPTVNVVASSLQKHGIIKYVHGRITILDRRRLEQGSCECYGAVRDLFAGLNL